MGSIKHNAYTLAEVLITVGIVGVIAAMTIPTLIQNFNSKRYVYLFKKSVSTLNQAATRAHARYDIDYSLLSLSNDAQACASDTLANSKYNLCGLFNSILSAPTYMGKYGDIKGEDGTTAYTAKVTSFPINSFLFFSLANGTFIAFNPNLKNCTAGESHVITMDMLTGEQLTNCIGFVDVNGVTPPNKEVRCSDGSTDLSVDSVCKVTDSSMGDIFPVLFYDGSVKPITNASLAVFLGGSTRNIANYFSNAATAEIKKIVFKGNEYEFKNGKYVYEDESGNYVDGFGGVFTKNSDGNYEGSDGTVYDKNMNVVGQTKNGYWFEYKGDVFVRDVGNGTYKGQGGMTYSPNANGGYNRSDGAVLDSNFNILGQNKNNTWYDYKNGFFVKENTDGNYIGSDGKIYTKDSDGRYVNNNTYYDKDMNIVGEVYKGNWFDYKSGLFVREMGDSSYKGHSMTYTKNEDGFYVRSDRNVYDEDFNLIGK